MVEKYDRNETPTVVNTGNTGSGGVAWAVVVIILIAALFVGYVYLVPGSSDVVDVNVQAPPATEQPPAAEPQTSPSGQSGEPAESADAPRSEPAQQ